MPYIKQDEEKAVIDQALEDLLGKMPVIKLGVVNYMITKIMQIVVKRFRESYDTYNSLVGVLECAKLEMFRRAVAKYEDKKIKENGDVY